jgi:proteasome lid subunit RPN8/RPN11
MTSKQKKKGVEPVVEMSTGVMRSIRQHARSSIKTEVCGVLIGDDDNGRVKVHAAIKGMNAGQGGAHVTFTQETWEHIYQTKDREYPDDRIVGWYHSHPAFGIFLSEHDLFIHQNFFSSPLQVAWVYDPVSDEEGCFGWVDGEIERLTRIVADDREELRGNATSEDHDDQDGDLQWETVPGKDHNRRDEVPAWVRYMNMALTHITALVLGAAAVLFLFKDKLDAGTEVQLRAYLKGVQDCATGRVIDLPLDEHMTLRRVLDSAGACMVPSTLPPNLTQHPAPMPQQQPTPEKKR